MATVSTPPPPNDVDEQLVDVVDDQPMNFRRPLEDSEMDITPMIDITFLLLIFFLVAARLDQDTPIELPPARHGTTVTVKNSVIITVAQSEGEQAAVFKGDGKGGDTQVQSADLEDQEQELIQYIEEQLTAGAKEHVIIKAEKGVRHGDVARVAKAAGKAGSGDLYVAVLEVQ